MIIARYVQRHALLAIIAAVLGLLLLKLMFDYLAQLDKINASYSYLDALRYIVYSAPEALQSYMPFGVLIGAVIGLGLLANHSELTVMQAAGLSRLRIIGWVMQPALVFVLLSLALSQFVLPTTNNLARQARNHKTADATSVNGYWQKHGDTLLAIGYANVDGEVRDVRQWTLSQQGEVRQMLHAERGVYQPAPTASATNPAATHSASQPWRLYAVQTLTIAADGSSQQRMVGEMPVSLPIAPSSIYLLTQNPEDMSLSVLWQHRTLMQSQQRRSLPHEVAFWQKLLSPFAVLSLVLVACSFVFGSLRNQSLGYRIVIALLFGLMFNYLQDLAGFVSLSTSLPPPLMIMLPIVLSAALGWYLLHKKV